MLHLERHDSIYVLHMRGGENRMNRSWLNAMNAALDEVDGTSEPKALVTTGSGKFYSNGLDLKSLMGAGQEEMAAFVADDERLFARMIATPYITVAACNGHTFAAGAMLFMVFVELLPEAYEQAPKPRVSLVTSAALIAMLLFQRFI